MKKIIFMLLAGALTFLLFSCGSTPEKETLPIEEPKVTESETANPDNTDELSKTESARQVAIDAGADKIASAQFVATDALFKKIKEQSASGVDTSSAFKELQDRYSALAEYSKAVSAKKKIDENGFASYDQQKYDMGKSSLQELEKLFSQSNLSGSSMLSTAKQARTSFDSVLFAAYKKLAKDERTEAFKAKTKADGIKAGAAAKDAYNNAVQEFKSGDSSYSMQNPEAAFNHYSNAKVEFSAVYATVLSAREAAQKAMEEAKNKVMESASYAQKADAEAPLSGEDVKGIEDADAKLLEDDIYEDSVSQESEIPETLLEGDE